MGSGASGSRLLGRAKTFLYFFPSIDRLNCAVDKAFRSRDVAGLPIDQVGGTNGAYDEIGRTVCIETNRQLAGALGPFNHVGDRGR